MRLLRRPDSGRDGPTVSAMTAPRPPGRAHILWWGLTRRCPRCGRGRLFRRWFHIVEDCPRCGLHFEREAGYWIGAMAINIGLTTGLLAVAFAAALATTIPDVPVGLLLAVFVPLALLLPIALYPFSKTLWMAVDRGVLQRMDPNERLDEQTRHI
jgi:uncharacterized protein (DUF983 family)